MYGFAEQHALHAIDSGGEESAPGAKELHTVNNPYKRIVLLYLANPYHLMSGEAATVYNFLNQWAAYGRLLTVDQVPSLEGNYFIDLNGEQPPKFALPGQGGANSAALRVLDVGPLVATIAATLKKLTDGHAGSEPVPMMFKDRIHRDMLQRLERAWGRSGQRKDERLSNTAQIVMAAGLSASHHFVSGEVAFFPEKDEVRFYRPEGIRSGLTLMPLEAVRSIGGVGSGGEYFRSLLLREDKTNTLLLPCAIYDVDTQLVLNSAQAITYVRLTRVLEATASFSQFEYEKIATPLSEQQNIDAIKSA